MSESGVEVDEAAQVFFRACADLDEVVRSAIVVSEGSIGIDHTGRQNRVLFLFAKMIVHDMSMYAIATKTLSMANGERLLDHFSLAALSRVVADAALMIMYMSHPGSSLADWNLRRHVLYLHELTNKKRFLFEADRQRKLPFFENYEVQLAKRRASVQRYAREAGLSEEDMVDLVKGNKVFVGGARAAVREAGWDVRKYDFEQSYFSAYVHSHPVSFMQADEHKISFQDPSPFQYSFAGSAITSAIDHTKSVTDRVVQFILSRQSDPIGDLIDES